MLGQLTRYQSHGHHHFVAFSCYRRLPYLAVDGARVAFERQLEKLRVRHGFYVFGYVLMPEHVHLLLSEPKRLVVIQGAEHGDVMETRDGTFLREIAGFVASVK